jgi:hypothetical protein
MNVADWFSQYETVKTPAQDTDWFSKYEEAVPKTDAESQSLPIDPEILKIAESVVAGPPKEPEKSGFLSRLGKGLWNSVVAMPAYVLKTKTPVGELGELKYTMRAMENDFREKATSGQVITAGEVDWYLSPVNKAGKVIQRPEWAVDLWNQYQKGQLNLGERSKEEELSQLSKDMEKGKLEWSQKADIFAKIEQAKSFTDKAADVLAGIIGFAARLAILKKVFPDLHPSILWEVENQVSGGSPGRGALMYEAFAIPGKVIPGKELGQIVKRAGVTSGAFGGITAVENLIDEGDVDLEQVAISAGIPWVLHAPEIIRAGVLLRNQSAVTAIVKHAPEAKRAVIEPEIQRVQVRRVPERKRLVGVEEPKRLPSPQKQLPMSADEAVEIKAHELYAGYLEKLSRGNKDAANKLSQLVQGLNLPSLADLYERLYMGDPQARADIEAGKYMFSPESYVLGLKTEAAQRLKIPVDQIQSLEIARGKQTVITPKPIPYGTQPGPEPKVKKAPIGMAAQYEVTYSPEGNIKTVKPVEKPVNPIPSQTGGAVDELLNWSKKAKRVSKEQWEPAVKALRKKQQARFFSEFRKAQKAGKGFAESVRIARKGFKQKAIRPDIESPGLTEEQWETLSKMGINVFGSYAGRLSNFQEALDNLRYKGKIPTDYEFGLFDKAFGRSATLHLYNNLAIKRSFNLLDIPQLLRDGLKSMFGYDPQTLRQFSTIKERHPLIYASAVWANLKAYGSKTQADKITTKIESSPTFKLAQEKGINLLGMTPWTASHKAGSRLFQYGDFTSFLLSRKNRVFKAWGHWLQASERGASIGANVGLLKLTEAAERQAQRMARRGVSQEEIDRFWKERAANINVFSKRVQAKSPSGRELQRAANWVLFSPSYTSARPLGTIRAIKQLVLGGDRTYAAEITASNIASIAAMSSIVAYAAHQRRLENPTEEPVIDSSTNPMNSLWGKVRVKDQVFDFTGGDAAWYRLMARVGTSAFMFAKDTLANTTTTKVAGEPVRKSGEEIQRYLTSRETVLLGLGKTMLTGKDWLGQPISRLTALLQHFPMEFLVDVVEAGHANGVWENLASGDIAEMSKDTLATLPIGLAGFIGLGVMSYPVPAVATRASFRDIIAGEAYKKNWTDLNPKQQSTLTHQYKKELENLDNRVILERVEKPVDINKIKDEEREAGDWIRQNLTDENRTKVVSTSLGLSRRPGDFYLNDERYQRYKELVVEELNKQLGRYKNPKENTVETILLLSKKLAWYNLQKEIK